MPINKPLTDKIINLLNKIHQLDPTALTNLIHPHTPCNNALANHPTIQVRGYQLAPTDPPPPTIGLLGILNGLAGTYDDEPNKGHGPITMQTTHNGQITGFHQTRDTNPPTEPNDPWTQLHKAIAHHPDLNSQLIDQILDLIHQHNPNTSSTTSKPSPNNQTTPDQQSDQNPEAKACTRKKGPNCKHLTPLDQQKTLRQCTNKECSQTRGTTFPDATNCPHYKPK